MGRLVENSSGSHFEKHWPAICSRDKLNAPLPFVNVFPVRSSTLLIELTRFFHFISMIRTLWRPGGSSALHFYIVSKLQPRGRSKQFLLPDGLRRPECPWRARVTSRLLASVVFVVDLSDSRGVWVQPKRGIKVPAAFRRPKSFFWIMEQSRRVRMRVRACGSLSQ